MTKHEKVVHARDLVAKMDDWIHERPGACRPDSLDLVDTLEVLADEIEPRPAA